MAGKANNVLPATWLRFGAAIGAVGIMIALSALIKRSMHLDVPSVLFIVPVIVAAALGGVMPGLVATAAGELALLYLYTEPANPFQGLNPTQYVNLTAFPIAGILVSLLSGRLMESRRHIGSILGSITDCYLRLDADWHVREVNARAAEYLGRPRREMLGQSLWVLFPWMAASETSRALQQAAARQSRIETELQCNGSWAELHIYPSPRSLVIYFRDISHRKKHEQALRESEEKFRSMAERARALIGIIQGEHFVYTNPYLQEVSGYSREELLTIDLEKLLHPDYRPIVLERARRRQAGEEVPANYEYIMLTRGGEERWVEISLARISLQGRPAIIGIGYDTTERKRIEAQLQHAKESAERANQLKDQFLAALSHELRTPLTPVVMAAESLASDSSLPEAVRRELEMIGRNIELEARLIDDLLDLTRISRGKLELKRQPADAHQLIEHAVDSCCRADSKARTLQLRVQLNAGRHHIDADPARVQQIIWNLMRNAIKFTPAGGAVMLRTRNTRENGQENPPLIIEVSDTGVGIPPERLERIFSPFEQGALEVTRKFGGLGLGLAISRALAELHDGTILAYSAGEGQGSTFTVELPTIPASAAMSDVIPPPPPAVVGPLRILIVEDHESTAQTLAQLLRSSGHEVEVAGMLGEALDLANTRAFDLIISDLGLPDGSGLDLMRQLRSRPNLRGIALSGYGMEEDVRKSLDAGFQEHLTKPINIHAVESAVARVMK